MSVCFRARTCTHTHTHTPEGERLMERAKKAREFRCVFNGQLFFFFHLFEIRRTVDARPKDRTTREEIAGEMCCHVSSLERDERTRGSDEEIKMGGERGTVAAAGFHVLCSSDGPFICFLRLALPVNRKSPIPTGSTRRRRGTEGGEVAER